MSEPLYIVDGSGFIFRAFHALPPLTRPDGTPINAVLGFTNMLLKLLVDQQAQYLCVVFDAGRETFRTQIYPEYKANRAAPPEELIPQFPLVRDVCKAFSVPTLELNGYEADDLIASLSLRFPDRKIIIVSSDKDLMQLVDERVTMLDPLKNKPIGPKEVEEKFGVPPAKVIEVQALAGDSVDNIPGIPGIGPKTAAELINTFGSLEQLLAQADTIPQPKRRERLQRHQDAARISYQLVTLKGDIPLTQPLEDFHFGRLDEQKITTFLEEQQFTSILARLQKKGFILHQAKPQIEQEYTVISDIATLEGWIRAAERQGWIAIDTETTSLQARTAKLVGISLATAPGQACYIPLAHHVPEADLFVNPKTPTPPQLPMVEVLALLKPMLEDNAILKVGQNLKYDMLVLKQHGITITPIDDTIVLSYILDGTKHGHGLDELAKHYFAHSMVTFKDLAGSGKGALTFDKIPIDKAAHYAAEDADYTGRLHSVLKNRLIKEKQVTVYEALDRPLVPVLAEMEYTGICIDAALLRHLTQEFETQMAGLATQIYQEAGQEFNIGSPKQLADIMFQELGYTAGKKGKAGVYSTSADVLEDLAGQGYSLPQLVLEWRQLGKLMSTYTLALVEQINPQTRRVHTSYGMTNTLTGRLSSNNPNLQNIPIRSEQGRKIREAFIAAPGYQLLSCDYSQIELRLLAHTAEMPTLREAYFHGADIHAQVAAEVFHLPPDKVDGAHRSRAKAINFGIIYGISPWGLARQLKIPQEEAAEYIERYFKRYPGIQDYMEKYKAFARQHGYVETLFGRRCYIPDIHASNYQKKSFAERQAINAPLQGSAADIIKRAMIQVDAALKQAQLKTRMLLQVHDELIFEVPDNELDKAKALIQKTMQQAAHLQVPLVVDAGVGPNWKSAH